MAGADYIVVTVEGVEQLELEDDSEGRFTSSLDSLIGVPTSGLRYNSRYRGVRVENGQLMRPYDGSIPTKQSRHSRSCQKYITFKSASNNKAVIYTIQIADGATIESRSQMSWMKLMLFWLPKSGGVGVMLQNQALIQWYQQLMMLASKAKEELYVERNDGTCWKPASGRKKGYP
eukprot:Em0003g1473a